MGKMGHNCSSLCLDIALEDYLFNRVSEKLQKGTFLGPDPFAFAL